MPLYGLLSVPSLVKTVPDCGRQAFHGPRDDALEGSERTPEFILVVVRAKFVDPTVPTRRPFSTRWTTNLDCLVGVVLFQQGDWDSPLSFQIVIGWLVVAAMGGTQARIAPATRLGAGCVVLGHLDA